MWKLLLSILPSSILLSCRHSQKMLQKTFLQNFQSRDFFLNIIFKNLTLEFFILKLALSTKMSAMYNGNLLYHCSIALMVNLILLYPIHLFKYCLSSAFYKSDILVLWWNIQSTVWLILRHVRKSFPVDNGPIPH